MLLKSVWSVVDDGRMFNLQHKPQIRFLLPLTPTDHGKAIVRLEPRA